MLGKLLVVAGLVVLSAEAFSLGPILKRSGSSSPPKPLQFRTDGSFQLAIFEDLHFGENAWDQWGPQQDINSVKVIGKVLDHDKPDFVVLNGDLITGDNSFLHNASVYIDQIVAPLVQRGLTWASTYGNHDSHYNLSREAILARERRYPNARTQQMVFGRAAGVSNYYLPVYSSSCQSPFEKCTPELLLWFFDSRGGFYFQEKDTHGKWVGQPDWVDESVVRWFEQTSHNLTTRYGKAIPSLAFVHIPTFASLAAQVKGIKTHYNPGVNDDYLLAPQAQGWCANGTNSGCDYGGQDVPFMKAIVSTPGLMAVFSGHDHGDTWCHRWDSKLPNMTFSGTGVNICFGQHSGYGGYGNWVRGARQVKVNQKDLQHHIIQSYITTELKQTIGRITLNGTFNSDYYPATKNVQTHCPSCNYSIITPMRNEKVAKVGHMKEQVGDTDFVDGLPMK